jgi:hypothetical protein
MLSQEHTAKRRWIRTIAAVFLLFACALVVYFAVAKRRSDTRHQQTADMMSARDVISARYNPAPELLKVVRNREHPCLWAVNGQVMHCTASQNNCWEVECQAQVNPEASRPISAKWLIDTKTIADTPANADAETMFVTASR